jgi:hypothetical protein
MNFITILILAHNLLVNPANYKVEGSWKLTDVELCYGSNKSESLHLNDAVFNFTSYDDQTGELIIIDDEGKKEYIFEQQYFTIVISGDSTNNFVVQFMNETELKLVQRYANYETQLLLKRIGN